MPRSSNPPSDPTYWASKAVYDGSVYHKRRNGFTAVADSDTTGISFAEADVGKERWFHPGLSGAHTFDTFNQSLGWGVAESLWTPTDTRGRVYIAGTSAPRMRLRFTARSTNTSALALGTLTGTLKMYLRRYNPVTDAYVDISTSELVSQTIPLAPAVGGSWGGASFIMTADLSPAATNYLWPRGWVPFVSLSFRATNVPQPVVGSSSSTITVAIGDEHVGDRESLRVDYIPAPPRIFFQESGTASATSDRSVALKVVKKVLNSESHAAGTHERVLTAQRAGVGVVSAASDAVKSATKMLAVDAASTGTLFKTTSKSGLDAVSVSAGTEQVTVCKVSETTARQASDTQRLLMAFRDATGSSTATGTGNRLLDLYREGYGDARGWNDPRKVKVCVPITALNDTNIPGPGDGGKAIAGEVYNQAGVPQEGVPVLLFRQSDNLFVGATSSSPTGAYSFPRDTADSTVYFTIAYTEGSPQTHGVSDRGLVPA